MKELIRNKLIHQAKLVGTSIRWVIFAILSGIPDNMVHRQQLLFLSGE